MKYLDGFFAVYFAIHIATTILIDASPFLPPEFAPGKQYLEAFVAQFKDPLMSTLPVWFKSILLGYCVSKDSEMVFQLPLCLYAVVELTLGSIHRARIPLIVYATHVITTMVPILGYIAFEPALDLVFNERAALVAIYFPYAAIPALMLWRLTAAWKEPLFSKQKFS